VIPENLPRPLKKNLHIMMTSGILKMQRIIGRNITKEKKQ